MHRSRRTVLIAFVNASFANTICAEGTQKLKIDVVGQFVDLLNDLLKLTAGTTEFVQKQADRQKAKEKAESLKELQNSLTTLSFEIQNSLQNGSNPALQQFRGHLEEGRPLDLEAIAVWTKDLAATTEASIQSFSKLPKAFAVDASYSQLLAAQNKRLLMFRKLGTLKGKASTADVRRMREAIDKWESANKDLEAAIKSLNLYIRTFDVLAAVR